jgi:hypothetical protein
MVYLEGKRRSVNKDRGERSVPLIKIEREREREEIRTQ